MGSEPSSPLPVGRTQLELVTAQLAAIDAWNRARHAVDAVRDSGVLTREMRLDLSRRREAVRREQEALLARVDAQLRTTGGESLSGRAATRAVVAHRHPWLRDNVARRLEARGVTVVGVFEDGADAAGTIVVEQPDLVLVEDRLPTLSGVEVVRRTREYAPQALVGAQCQDSTGVAALTDAGAHAVFTRRVPPLAIADQLIARLSGSTDGAAADDKVSV